MGLTMDASGHTCSTVVGRGTRGRSHVFRDVCFHCYGLAPG